MSKLPRLPVTGVREFDLAARDPQARTIGDKIARLRQRIKDAPNMDANTRAVLLGILDLLGDEL